MKQGKRSCSTCFFAEEVMANNLQRQYICHRFPPGQTLAPLNNQLVPVTMAPQMNARQWCAEFWPKTSLRSDLW